MKMYISIVLFAVAFAASVNALPSSLDEELPSNIITNGQTAPAGKAPYIVFLRFQSGNTVAWCGGSIIGNTWVVTASHCTKPYNAVTVYYGSLQRAQGAVTHTVRGSNIINHASDDIALIRTPHVAYTNDIKPVRLPSFADRNNKYEYQWSTACGWGRTATNNTPDRLQCVDLQVITNAQCARTYGTRTITDQILCVSTPGGRSTCQGDSGGPLVLRSTGVLIGVTNFVSVKGCTAGDPSGFARVTSHLNWIRQHTGISY